MGLFSTRYRKPDPFPQLRGMGGQFDDPKVRPALDLIGETIARWGRTIEAALTGDLRPHAETHKAGGADLIRLDELGAPTDVTTLNASTSTHGLLPKLSGNSTDVLHGDGTWSAGGGAGGTRLVPLTTILLGEPQFVWDNELNLIMAEEAI